MESIRNTLIVLLLLLLSLKCFGQETYTKIFSYDQNGNRIRYELLLSKADKGSNSIEDTPYMSSATDTLIDLAIQIFPNPTNDKVFVSSIGNETSKTVKAVLMTSTGSVLEEKQLVNSMESLDLTAKATGLYFLEISTDKAKHLWKIIKR